MWHILNEMDECVDYCKHDDDKLEGKPRNVENLCGRQLSLEGPICDLSLGHDGPCNY